MADKRGATRWASQPHLSEAQLQTPDAAALGATNHQDLGCDAVSFPCISTTIDDHHT